MRRSLLALLCGSVTWCVTLFASEASHGINWWHLGSKYKDAPAIGWLTITFLIFVYGLVRVIRKPLSLYLETRSKDIRRQIEEGQRIKRESEEKLRLYQEKLSTLDDEIKTLKATFVEQAEAERKERERLTKEIESRILREAEDTIRADYERAKTRLADEVVRRAMALAEATIAEKKREQVDEILKSSFINELKAEKVVRS